MSVNPGDSGVHESKQHCQFRKGSKRLLVDTISWIQTIYRACERIDQKEKLRASCTIIIIADSSV